MFDLGVFVSSVYYQMGHKVLAYFVQAPFLILYIEIRIPPDYRHYPPLAGDSALEHTYLDIDITLTFRNERTRWHPWGSQETPKNEEGAKPWRASANLTGTYLGNIHFASCAAGTLRAELPRLGVHFIQHVVMYRIVISYIIT
jgi:hypothetical protein